MGSEKIISGRASVYTAAVGTAAVEPNAASISSSWTLLGEEFYSEDGVSLDFTETIEGERVLGSTMIQKAFRTEESGSITVNLKDVTVATLSKLLNDNSITNVAAASGVIGTSQVSFYQGHDVSETALMIRGYAPYTEATAFGDMVWYFPRTYATIGSFTMVKTAIVIPVTFTILDHSTSQMGYLKAKTANAI